MANLIVYFSRAGENNWNGDIRSIDRGNTQRVAEYIQNAVGGDLFEIRTLRPYSDDYYECASQAKEEWNANARPELAAYLGDLSGYENIFVGYPNWWETCPMAVFSLLERADLSGKRIIPFCTNEGGGLGNSERDLKKVCKGAKLLPGLSVHGAGAEVLEALVSSWAKRSV